MVMFMLASCRRRTPRNLREVGTCLALSLAVGPAFACTQVDPPGTEDDVAATDSADNGSDTVADTDSGSTDDTVGTTDTTDTTTDDTSSTSDTGNAGADSLYPLIDGAQWTYVAKTLQGDVLGMEIVNLSETTFEGQQAFLQVDNPNQNGVWDESVLMVLDGDLTARVHREEKTVMGTQLIVDYTHPPGFARVRDSWTTVGNVEELFYDRTETDGMGLNPMTEARGHTFKVLAVDKPVTVPAGTFNCVEIERVRTVGAAAGERVVSWYAFGIGKVREERLADSEVEELVSVNIPGGAVYP